MIKIIIKKDLILFVFFIISFTFIIFFAPQNTFAQYVPVKDAELLTSFNLYKESLTDPVTGAISGSDYLISSIEDIATENCATYPEPKLSNKLKYKFSDKEPVGIYKKGWKDMQDKFDDENIPVWVIKPFRQWGNINFQRDNKVQVKEDGVVKYKTMDGDPANTTDPQNTYFFLPTDDELNDAEINASNSLRCLLQEMVEWKKLDLNMQLHTMIKDHFSNAQTYMLNQQLLNTLAAATIAGAQKFEQTVVGEDGKPIITNTSVYVENLGDNISNVQQKEIDGLYHEILGDNEKLGSLSLPQKTKEYIANQIKRNLEAKKETSFVELQDTFKVCEIDPDNVVCTPIVASSIIEKYANEIINQAEQNRRQQLSMSGGYLSTEDCGEDPYCRNSTVKTPGDILAQNLYNSLQTGINAMAGADTAGKGASGDAQYLTLDIMEKGLDEYKVTNLLGNQQTLAELFNEFEFVLTDYYGIDEGTTNWARNSLVNTWDDIMWGGGAATKATELDDQLKAMKKKVEQQIGTCKDADGNMISSANCPVQ